MIVNINETLSQIQTQVWSEDGQIWVIYETTPGDYCDVYAVCGPNANCRITEPPVCQCLKGFKPKPPQEWIPSMDWSQGCVRPKPLSCEEIDYMDHFVKYVGLKVPDTTYTWLDENINLEECRLKCFNNCSCMAFANSDIRGGGRCLSSKGRRYTWVSHCISRRYGGNLFGLWVVRSCASCR